MKKNVLQLNGGFHQGGSECQAVQLAKLLSEEGAYKILLAFLINEFCAKKSKSRFIIPDLFAVQRVGLI